MLEQICADAAAEAASLLGVIEEAGGGAPEGVERVGASATPAVGWTIHDQITHLAYFDEQARLSITEPDRFRVQSAAAAAGDQAATVDALAAQMRSMSFADALAWFGRERAALIDAARAVDGSTRVPWYGPDMTVTSSVTARVMETWAHGVDVTDTLGIPVTVSERLRHVAFIGWRALPYAYMVHRLDPPSTPVRLVLDAPDGSTWEYGPPEASDVVSGPALDFCLLVVQRRHRDDTRLAASGAVADQWLSIAQAFAGPAGPGRAPSGEPS